MRAAYQGMLASMSRTVSATWVIGPSTGVPVQAGAVSVVVTDLSSELAGIGRSDACGVGGAVPPDVVDPSDEPTGAPSAETAVHRPPLSVMPFPWVCPGALSPSYV